MNSDQFLSLSDEKILEIGKQLQVSYKLKKTLRYAGSRDMSVHGESVAEHIFALLFLAQYFLPIEDPEGKLDIVRIHEMILFHDLVKFPMEMFHIT